MAGRSASSAYMPLGVEPPESATENLPRAAMAAVDWVTNSRAAASNSSRAVGRTWISSELGMNLTCHPGAAGCAEKGGFVIGDDQNRHGFHQRLHPPLGNKRLHEQRTGEPGEQFGGDASTQVDAAGGQKFQAQVTGFGAVEGDEKLDRVLAERALAGERRLRNSSGGIGVAHFIAQPLGFGSAASVAQEMEQIHQSGAGDGALVTDVAEALLQIAQQVHLQFVAGSKVTVPAFTGKHVMLPAVPVHAGFAQTRTGGNDRLISHRMAVHLVQGDHIARLENSNAPGVGFQIVDEQRFLDFELVGKNFGFDEPGQVRGFYLAVAHGTGDAEAGNFGAELGALDKLGDDLVQPREVTAGEDG